jgi:hypothetical protein
MYIMAGLLVVGFICNLLVKPVSERVQSTLERAGGGEFPGAAHAEAWRPTETRSESVQPGAAAPPPPAGRAEETGPKEPTRQKDRS